MKSAILPTALALLAIPAAAQAEAAPEGGTVVRLSDTEMETIKEAAAARNASSLASADGIQPKQPFFGPVHGSVSMAIGTGGFRALSGEAYARMGDDGEIAVRVTHVEANRSRKRHRR